MYADDTGVTSSAEDIDNPCNDLTTELTRISEWTRQNELCLNANKSEFLIGGHKRQLNGIYACRYRFRQKFKLERTI